MMSPWNRWLKHWFGHSPRKTSGRKRKRYPCRLNLEQLESRLADA